MKQLMIFYCGERMILHKFILLFSIAVLSDAVIEQIKEGFDSPFIESPESRLHKYLFGDAKRAFPLVNKVVNISFGLTLKSVVDVDASNEAIILNAFIRQKWHNPDIAWDPEEYGGIQSINIHPDVTWIPDIFAYANIYDNKNYNGLLSTMKTRINVNYEGYHSWLAPVILRLGCTMNFRNFPFDTQVCPLSFGSFTYDSSSIAMVPEAVDMASYSESSEWIYISMDHKVGNMKYPGSHLPFVEVTYTLIVKRKPLHIIMNLVLPNGLLAFMTVMVFQLPVNAGERVGYILNILLALSWFMVSNVNTMPSSSESIPLFSYFIGSNLLILCTSLICLCYTVGCHYANSKVVKLPPWLRKFILGKLASYFEVNVKRRNLRWRRTVDFLNEQETWDQSFDHNAEDFMEKPGKLWTTESENFLNRSGELADVFGQRSVQNMNLKLGNMLDQITQKDDVEWMQKEWKLVAVTLDKLLFYLFSGIYGLSVVSHGITLLQIE